MLLLSHLHVKTQQGALNFCVYLPFIYTLGAVSVNLGALMAEEEQV